MIPIYFDSFDKSCFTNFIRKVVYNKLYGYKLYTNKAQLRKYHTMNYC